MTETMISYDADHYVQRLDLGEDPFTADFDPDYFYAGANRQALVDQLIHFSRFSKQTVLLLGATGSGSSCLLDKAFFALKEVMDCCYLDAELIKQEQEIIESLSHQLQLGLSEGASVSELVMGIQSVALVDGEPEPVLLAVDQAHFLSLESYALLREVVNAGDNLIRLVLAGEYQVEQLAMLSGFNRDCFKRFELEPLSKQETGEYLLGLLQSVGYAGELPLTGDQLAVLHEQSGGNIADINQLAPKLLVSESDAERGTPRLAIPIAHVAAIAILVLAVAGGWVYQGQNKPDGAMNNPAPAETKPVVPERISQPLPLPVLAEKHAEPSEELHDERVGKIERQVPAGAGKPNVAVTPQAGADSESSPAAQISASGQRSEREILARQESGSATAPSAKAMDSKVVNAESGLAAADSKVAAIKESSTKVSGTQKELGAAKNSAIESSVVKASERKGAESKPPEVTEAPLADIPDREQKLLAYPQNGYLLQLMGALEEQRAKSFVQQYEDQLPVTYFETRLKGKPWFVAVTGPYDDKDQALAGIKQLPASLQKQRPWARTVASVQNDIRGNRR